MEDLGVAVVKVMTGAQRGSTDIGVPSLALHMRSRTIRLPAMTAEDRRRSEQVKQHFKNWDARELGTRTRSGAGGHRPDDRAMAAWVGFAGKVFELLEQSMVREMVQNFAPTALLQRYRRMAERNRQEQSVRAERVSNHDVISMVLGPEGD